MIFLGEEKGALYLPGFKHPMAFSIFIYVIPPTQTDHESTCDVLVKMNTNTHILKALFKGLR